MTLPESDFPDPKTVTIFRKAEDILNAFRARIMRNRSRDGAALSEAIADGLMERIFQLEAAVQSLATPAFSGDCGKILASCRQQRARIEAALAAAAQAAGAKDISAPASDEAIGAFLRHFDDSWHDFVKPIWQTDTSGAGYSHKYLWHLIHVAAVGVREAMYQFQRLRYFRHPVLLPDRAPVDLGACVQQAIDDRIGESIKGERAVSIRSDQEQTLILTNPLYDDFLAQTLIKNAMMFSPKNTEIRVNLTREGNTVAFFVDDDGPGFSDVSEAESTQPFSRSAKAAGGDMPYCRLGLGLHVLKLAADKSGLRFEFAKGKRGRRPLLLFPAA